MTEVRAPMPANVIDILVAVGDSVEEYQELVILESMKMEVPVEAPAAGTIEAINVAAGEAVAENQVLLTLST
jgi:acetyl-CoA carboxylase biotin carboxyl carrier protein